jgi:hypothetical protein
MRLPVTCAMRAMLLVSLAVPTIARAQAMPAATVAPELRIDGLAADRQTGIQIGGGLQIPAGLYTRIGMIAAIGPEVVDGGTRLSGRFDVLARFLFDPFRQNSWGLSAGAGVSLRAVMSDNMRPLLLAAIDLEGPLSARGISPAFQLGLGGGVRLGAVMRWGARGSR